MMLRTCLEGVGRCLPIPADWLFTAPFGAEAQVCAYFSDMTQMMPMSGAGRVFEPEVREVFDANS